MHHKRAVRTVADESSPLGRVHFHFAALVDMLRADEHYSTRSADVRKGPTFTSAVKMCGSIYRYVCMYSAV